MAASSTGSVAIAATAPNAVKVLGASIDVLTIRWIAAIGFILGAAAAAALVAVVKLSGPYAELARLHSKYGHLIVPVIATDDALNWVPFDVPTIEALARIAESGGRLILHHRDGFIDTLLVQDDTIVYRYQIQTPVQWGEWSAPDEHGLPDPREVGRAPADGEPVTG